MVEHMNSTGKPHQVCAMTGCAAVLLNCKAKTIHSWSGIKMGRGTPEEIVKRVSRNRCAMKNWRGIEVLVVDEISMMSSKMFDVLNRIGQLARKNYTKPFGGIQLVFIGDFFQLPPIADYEDPATGDFCFQHPIWEIAFKREDSVELATFFRQTDPVYIGILQEIRKGHISEDSIGHLERRVLRGGQTATGENGVVPTKLFPVRNKVDFINETMYNKLEGDERVYHLNINTRATTHIDSGSPLSFEEFEKCRELDKDQISSEIDAIAGSMMSEKTVRLKIGAVVMCVVNLDVERGICNGSQGVVIDFVEIPSGFSSIPDAKQDEQRMPVVRFANGVIMRITPHQRQSEEYPCITISQLPLCLAWAMTIHKIQGATLDMAEMDIGRSVFAAGQSYVALSRVKTLDGLFLSEFNYSKIKSDSRVVEFYENTVRITAEEMEKYVNIVMPVVQSIPVSASLSSASRVRKPNQRSNPFERYGFRSDEMKPDSYEESSNIKTIRLV
jgi:ATP-dependent DNA helicase PIF1